MVPTSALDSTSFTRHSLWGILAHQPLLQPGLGGNNLANLSGIVEQLSKERYRLHQQLSGLNAALEAFAGVYRGTSGIKPRRKMSAKGRASIAAAQRARWAKVKGHQTASKSGKRAMSASARRNIAAAQRARWAKVRREKKAA